MDTNRSTAHAEGTTPVVPETLSAAETKLVYLYLQATDRCTVDDLCRDLGMRKLSVLPLLDALRERGMIDEGDVVQSRGS